VPRLARKAVHKTPAEIENIVKEAALIAARSKRDLIIYKDFSEAIERVELGVAHRLSLNPHEKEMTAFHEAGHLLALYLTHPTSDVFKVSILNRGGALGVVHSTPTEEIYAADKDTLLAHIRTALGGYAAEKIKYGVTTEGVRSDFAKATTLAHDMVWRLGMGKSGFIGDFTVIPQHERSSDMGNDLNREAQELIKGEYEAVNLLLKENWPIVERFVKELLAREELDYDEIALVFSEYGKPPRPLKKG
jgi:cell division protease FtsH